MKNQNIAFMRSAKESLHDKWGIAAGVSVVLMIILTLVNGIPKVGPILSIIIGGAFTLGYAIFILTISRAGEPHFEQLFEGFRDFERSTITYLLMTLYVLLWTLLLIIPGIIAAISYSMTFYILADDKNIKPGDALRKSKVLMDGHKLQLFYLGLRFIGWGILSIITFGIGFIWLMPYMQVTFAKFYDELKNNNPDANIKEAEIVKESSNQNNTKTEE